MLGQVGDKLAADEADATEDKDCGFWGHGDGIRDILRENVSDGDVVDECAGVYVCVYV